MNKKQQRELENKLREATLDVDELTPERIAGIRERAHAAYQQKMTDKARPKVKAKTGSGLLRRAAAVFAIAVGLIVVSVVYTALAPVSSGNANSFVRRAAIWVNDQLHLGISFPVPEDEGAVSQLEEQTFTTLKEAVQSLNTPIICIQEDAIQGLSFTSLETVSSENTFISLLSYKLGEKSISISIEPLLDNALIDISQDKVIEFSSPIGTLFILDSKEANWAFAYYNGYLIEIYGSVSEDLFLLCCSSLEVIN